MLNKPVLVDNGRAKQMDIAVHGERFARQDVLDLLFTRRRLMEVAERYLLDHPSHASDLSFLLIRLRKDPP